MSPNQLAICAITPKGPEPGKLDLRKTDLTPRGIAGLKLASRNETGAKVANQRCEFLSSSGIYGVRRHSRLTRPRSATAGEGERELQWACFHKVKRGSTSASGWL